MRAYLERLVAELDVPARLAADPVAFPRRYDDPRDIEIAGIVASQLAYGRVDLFRPVVDRVLRWTDARGGPRGAVEAFDPSDAEALWPVVYRWNRGVDLVLLFAALRRVLERVGTVEALFVHEPSHPDVRVALAEAIDALREAAVEVAPSCGVEAQAFSELPRGFRMMVSSPRDGSACKRWNMYLRWMVRPPTEGIDLGTWSSIPTDALVVPLDTHVSRIARFIGLTARRDGSWRTAAEVTAGLARLDPADPVRFDFALAHLGISRGCLGRFEAEVCPACPLAEICVEARA